MSLIKNAQILSTLSESQIEQFTKIQQLLGLSSIVEAVEELSTAITPHDYEEWLRIIREYGEELGADLSNVTSFEDIAWEMLDNDPKLDAIGGDEEVKRHVVNTLWHAFNTAQHHQQVSTLSSNPRAVEDEAVDKKASKSVEFIKHISSNPALSKVYRNGISAANAAKSNPEQKAPKSPYSSGTLRDKAWKTGFQHGSSGK